MNSTYDVPSDRLFRALGCALGLGILAATLLIHITISVVAPGDAGVISALFSPILPVFIAFVVGWAGVLILPIVASITWRWRNAIANRPILATLVATVSGALCGYFASFAFADHWYSSQLPGIVAGGAFGLVWILVVRWNAVIMPDLDAFQ